VTSYSETAMLADGKLSKSEKGSDGLTEEAKPSPTSSYTPKPEAGERASRAGAEISVEKPEPSTKRRQDDAEGPSGPARKSRA
jgi:hypothetical protein